MAHDNNRRMKWTVQADMRAEELAGKVTPEEIAKELGCTVTALETRASKVGISLRMSGASIWRETPEENKAVVEMYKAKVPRKVIAKKFGVNENQIGRIAYNAGVCDRRGHWSEQESADVAWWYGHIPSAKLGAVMGKSDAAITSEMHRIRYGLFGRKSREWYQKHVPSSYTAEDFGLESRFVNHRKMVRKLLQKI